MNRDYSSEVQINDPRPTNLFRPMAAVVKIVVVSSIIPVFLIIIFFFSFLSRFFVVILKASIPNRDNYMLHLQLNDCDFKKKIWVT